VRAAVVHGKALIKDSRNMPARSSPDPENLVAFGTRVGQTFVAARIISALHGLQASTSGLFDSIFTSADATNSTKLKTPAISPRNII
jgi:hypothetical protein